jgi:hypothetical protein
MNKKLGTLVAQGLDLNLFWYITITDYQLQLRGDYSRKLVNYILSKGFEKYDYIYEDNDKEFEYTNGECRILLSKQK